MLKDPHNAAEAAQEFAMICRAATTYGGAGDSPKESPKDSPRGTEVDVEVSTLHWPLSERMQV